MTANAFTIAPPTMKQRLRRRLSYARDAGKRWRSALRYATGTLTRDDALGMMWRIQEVAGEYPLSTLSIESVLEQARERFGDHPALAGLADSACARVYQKWSGSDDAVGAAEDWAMEKIIEYAEVEGIKLHDNWGMGETEGPKEVES